MFLIIIGVLVLVITAVLLKSNSPLARFRSVGRIVGLLFILLGILTSCIKQINAGEVGVKILFGNIQADVLGSGLHFINPLLDVKRLDVKTQNYTMS
ncbi:MAG TPA: SPFH domain-containing protein, partial [Ferruginibacter sp.]|nr:SPFH domain-containing protein [Ferruginibacter sp.]